MQRATHRMRGIPTTSFGDERQSALARPARAHARRLRWVAGLTLAGLLYTAGIPGNPLPFLVDESSIAYNAFTISQSGRDEFGEPWPLYFAAFGEYKNPTFIYVLAGLFKLFGPSIVLARLLSATAGLLAILLIGLLTARACPLRGVGTLVTLSGLLTPWLFEISRLVFEVALYPLVLAAFLWVLHRAASTEHWALLDSAGLAVALALLTYSYSIGRVLAPLLALGLLLFAGERRWARVAQAWALYAVTLVPLFAFSRVHPGALSGRFELLTYITPGRTWSEIALAFAGHYLGDVNPGRVLLTGDPSPEVHAPGMGVLLVATAALALAGAALVVRRHWREPWWRFVLYGTAVALVPTALTRHGFHALRLVALPVFLLVLTGPAWAELLRTDIPGAVRRGLLGLAIGLTVLQGAAFQWHFYQVGLTRDFDRGYLSVFDAATRLPSPSLYLPVGPGRLAYIHAYWYGTLYGLDPSRFTRFVPGDPLPAGALVIGELDDSACSRCRILIREGRFGAYRTL
jgi:4-amino-4-deoxy-L-arabinose transferase-like glycosyltransferase